ncbi:hypothetical protein Daus18300_011206 [Diaporthe australafricana]|uniref:Uncharacterized protein n=1 Tax=Diaporthe australafricana TaxID=127596 RepID=A0ABR3W7F2_9PEZI
MAYVYDEEEVDTSFDLILEENTVGSGESGVVLKAPHTIHGTNLGGEEQSTCLADSDLGKDRVVVKCDMTQIVHGSMTRGGSPATLVVFQFRFISRVPDARIKSADITLHFPAGKVRYIVPEETSFVMRSTTTREISHSVSPKLQVAGGGFVNVGCDYTLQRKETTGVNNYAQIKGIIRAPRRAGGRWNEHGNRVQWNLWENKQIRSGVPDFMQTALLLERDRPAPGTQEANFIAELSMVVDVDTHTSRKQLSETVKDKIFGDRNQVCEVKFSPRLNKGSSLADADMLDNMRPYIDQQFKLLGLAEQVDGAEKPELSVEKPELSVEKSEPPNNKPEPAIEGSETLQPQKNKSSQYAASVKQTQSGGKEAPGVCTNDSAAEHDVVARPSIGGVLMPDSIGHIAHTEDEPVYLDADSGTELELQEQLDLIRAEVGFVKRLVDLTREERIVLGKLRRIQRR